MGSALLSFPGPTCASSEHYKIGRICSVSTRNINARGKSFFYNEQYLVRGSRQIGRNGCQGFTSLQTYKINLDKIKNDKTVGLLLKSTP